MGSLPVYARILGSRLRAQWVYRVSFVLHAVSSLALSFADFLAILVIFRHIPRLGGWSLAEVAFLYGTSYAPFKVADLVVGRLDSLPAYLRTGWFDGFLTRPLGTLGQTVTVDVDLPQIGALVEGAAVLAVALSKVDVHWTIARAAMLVVMLAGAVVIYAAIWVAGSTICFWLIDSREAANAFTFGGNELAQYPLHVFGRWLRRLFTFVVPVAFVNYFPALYVLGKRDPFGAPSALRFASPAVAVAAAAGASAMWRTAVRRYRSTGS